jgi:serine/threonine-protein kinase
MLAGEPAFSGTSVQSIITKNITGPRPKVRIARKDAPESVERVLLKALAKEPGERFATMTEFADALGAAEDAAARGMSRMAKLAIAALVVVAVGSLGAVWMTTRGARGPVVEDAERIAVFPFSTTGPGLEMMGEGMVDLMSTNLGGVGGITTVEPRTVLARWKKRGGGAVDLEGALAVAKDVDAGAVLLGSAVAVGPKVRLTAEMFNRAGEPLGKASIDGHPDSVLSLVDQLSVSLMREIWRSNEPIPSLRVAGLTTASLPALRAYLQGEQFYRRSLYDSASIAFGRAIEADSTFALAYYRQVMSNGWIGNYGSRASREAMAAAQRLGAKLPERERTILQAYKLFTDGRPEAADVMRQYLAANPKDADAWYLLGESLMHSRTLVPYDPATLRAPFDSVIALDASLTPAAIHPLELTLAYRDSAAYARYMRVIEDAGAEGEVALFGAAGRAVWGRGEDLDSLFGVLSRAPQQGANFNAAVSVIRQEGATSDTLVARIRSLARGIAAARPNERFAPALPAMMLAGAGRVREAGVLADSFATVSQDLGYAIRAIPVFAGFASKEYTERGLATLRRAPKTNPWQLFTQAQLELVAGNAAAVPELLATARRLAADTTKFPAEMGGLLTAVDGWRMIEQGDTTGGLQRLDAGMRRAGATFVGGTGTMAIRLRWAQTLAARPATREEGIRRLRYGFDQDPMLVPIATFSLAKAYEAAGNREEASAAYGRFLRLWDKADPEYRSYADDARASLARLVGEKGS